MDERVRVPKKTIPLGFISSTRFLEDVYVRYIPKMPQCMENLAINLGANCTVRKISVPFCTYTTGRLTAGTYKSPT